MSNQPRPRVLNFITGSANKVKETRTILADVPGLELQSRNVEGVEIQGSIEEVARDKCSRAARAVNGPVLTEDTALEFQALKGLPGPYIKYFLQALGHEGLNNMLAAYEDKTAFAVCTFAYCAGPDHEPILFQGRCQGKIVPARGPPVFGWDAVFEFEDGQTYAEMEKEKKNLISHRGKALAKLKAWLAGGDLEP
ncbi:RdgB/HAM1 family non-canonical purine NTP pyrophosphatase [Phialophora macrospora]|uniref:Inosine triphosphate pyrophosphatase n=1 Tax=Phialophora macrospora TaxID=1851006 RepID=A0A0D2FYK8_9EURO|nr:RdgB/HAM1 family non-canonical purine NTP pyrophosphatase [Phialophora macrospora]